MLTLSLTYLYIKLTYRALYTNDISTLTLLIKIYTQRNPAIKDIGSGIRIEIQKHSFIFDYRWIH